MDSLQVMAPFLTANWPILGVAALVILGMTFFLTSTQAKSQENSFKKAKTPTVIGTTSILDRGEHPLSEFEDEKPDPTLAPPLHDADTPQIPFKFERIPEGEMLQRSKDFYLTLNKRRSIRFFSTDPIPSEVLENIVRAAGTAPSGAHCEPWTFVVVRDPKLKSQIRDIVEQEEYTNYDRRMGDKWVHDLQFINTTHEKSYLDDAPAIILVIKQQYHIDENQVKHPHYYFEISTAIAAGVLITAIHMAGLVTVTTTPLNAGVALRELLGRPSNEKVMLLLPVGYPSHDASVPDVKRKPLEDILVVK